MSCTETEHYAITKSFLNNPDGVLRELSPDPQETDSDGGPATNFGGTLP